jgi:hypothetical protein
VVQLGDKVRDRLTGFTGIVIAITEWLYNCRRITVQPTDLDKDGTVKKTDSFDEDQLEVVKAGAFKAKVEEPAAAPAPALAKTGGPREAPSRRSDPSAR